MREERRSFFFLIILDRSAKWPMRPRALSRLLPTPLFKQERNPDLAVSQRADFSEDFDFTIWRPPYFCSLLLLAFLRKGREPRKERGGACTLRTHFCLTAVRSRRRQIRGSASTRHGYLLANFDASDFESYERIVIQRTQDFWLGRGRFMR